MYPKVALSAGNIAHYHHTALALQKAGYLWKYFCVFSGKDDLGFMQRLLPADLRKRLSGKVLPDLDSKKIRTFAAPYLFSQGLRRAGLAGQARVDALFGRLYDRATLYHADDADIFHFVNGMGLQTARRAKERGCIVICDVRAEHVDVQEQVLRDEYERLNLPYRSMRALYRDRLVAEYDLADYLFVPSSYVAETFIRSGIAPEKIFVVPYGVDTARFSIRPKHEELNRKKHPFRVLFVGQLTPRKGIHYLIQAFTKLRLPNSELVIVGHGEIEYQKLLQEMLSSEDQIRFGGHLPQVELSEYYQNSDVFILPTLSEGSALVIYEAMSAGLPVITTPNAGSVIRDGQDGFIVPIRNVETLQDKIMYLFENPDACQKMGIASQERVREFSWERYGDRLLNVFDQILSEIKK